MKYPQNQMQKIANHLSNLMAALDVVMKPTLLDHTEVLLQLHHKLYANLTYRDDNSNVIKDANGQRVLPYDPLFKMYPVGCNDTHLVSAVKKVMKFLLDKDNEKKPAFHIENAPEFNPVDSLLPGRYLVFTEETDMETAFVHEDDVKAVNWEAESEQHFVVINDFGVERELVVLGTPYFVTIK